MNIEGAWGVFNFCKVSCFKKPSILYDVQLFSSLNVSVSVTKGLAKWKASSAVGFIQTSILSNSLNCWLMAHYLNCYEWLRLRVRSYYCLGLNQRSGDRVINRNMSCTVHLERPSLDEQKKQFSNNLCLNHLLNQMTHHEI